MTVHGAPPARAPGPNPEFEALAHPQTAPGPEPACVKVWDWPVRALHAALASEVVASGATGWWWHDAHEPLGYAIGAIVLARLLWSRWGTAGARFGRFVRSPRDVITYARQLRQGRAPRHLGHNPLGGWMVVALLATVTTAVVSGVLYTTDWLWGYAWVFTLHAAAAWGLAGLIAVHVAGVWWTGRHQRECLVAAMVHGRKRAPAAGDVPP